MYPYRGRGYGHARPPVQYFSPPTHPPPGSPMYRNMSPGGDGYMMNLSDYDDGGSPYGMRSGQMGNPGTPGRGMGRGGPALPSHLSNQTPRQGSGRATNASEGSTPESGFESGAELERKTNQSGANSGYAKDCEILVLQKSQIHYGEMVERQLRERGLKVDMVFPNPGTPIQESLKHLAKLGTIFAVVIDPECERGKTLNFYQFRGIPKPQYHKNVSLSQAYGVIMKIYNELKNKEIGIVPDSFKDVMAKIVNEDTVPDADYAALIRILHERKRRQNLFLNRTSNVIPDLNDPKANLGSLIDTTEGKELQKRILKILDED